MARPLLHQMVPTILDHIEVVRLNVAEGLLLSAGPRHLDAFGAYTLAQTEMHPKIALRKVTTTP